VARPAEFREQRLQFVGSSDDDPDTEHVQFKKQAEGREVAIKKRVFIVPLGFNRHAALVVVDMVSGRERLVAIRRYFYVETLLHPTALEKEGVDGPGDWRFVPSVLSNVALPQLELAEDVNQIFPLFWEVSFKDRAGMVAFFDLVSCADIVGKQVFAQSQDPFD
jgi:hypothetical protein